MARLSIWQQLKQTAVRWSDDNAARLAASLAFYAVLSIAPLLVLAVAVAGWFFGSEQAREHVGRELAQIVGPSAGEGVKALLDHAQSPEDSKLGSLLGGLVLVFGASGVFGELQAALNTIWEVEPRKGAGIWGYLRQRFLSFSMVMGVAFLLLVSLLASAALAAVGEFFTGLLPAGGATIWEAVNFVFSFAVITVLFALIFKVVPDVVVAWRDVWLGAAATAFLFTVGKFALGLYLGRASVASPYGAAGSVVVLVIWVYYAAQILFFGAEFTQVAAQARGRPLVPSDHAQPTPEAKLRAEKDGAAPKRDGLSVPGRVG